MFSVVGLCLFGLMMIYSSSCVWAEYKFNDSFKFFKRLNEISNEKDNEIFNKANDITYLKRNDISTNQLDKAIELRKYISESCNHLTKNNTLYYKYVKKV